MKAYVLLANGFEEVEALTTADVLARAGVKVELVKVETADGGSCKAVAGSHGFKIKTDFTLTGEAQPGTEEGVKAALSQLADGDCLVLPGGMPGTKNLGADKAVAAVITDYNEKGKLLAAICAAPSVLGDMGLLKNRKATCFPGFEERLTGASVSDRGAEADGNIVTGKSMGSAVTFGLKVVEVLLGKAKADQVEASLYRA